MEQQEKKEAILDAYNRILDTIISLGYIRPISDEITSKIEDIEDKLEELLNDIKNEKSKNDILTNN